MSQAEDLLNSLSENDISTKTEPHIVVGSNRVITVPSELKRIAVQYDHNIETVTFDCPRYWDDHDMSTMKVYINYTRADNEPGCYIADDVAVDETDTSIMHFSWTISRHVTEAVGPLTILICIKMVDKDGNEVNHWNSERNTDMTISQGMECGDIIVNKYPDVITYLLEDMGNLADLTTEDKSSLVAAINEAAASGGSKDAVTYTPQTLTEAQQKQALTNIGAGQPLFVVNVTTTLSEQGDEVYTVDKTAAEIETAYQEGCEIVCRMSVPIIGMGLVPVQLPLASRRGRQIFMFAINQTMWTDKSSRIVSYLVTIADDGVSVGQNNTEIYIKPASGIPKTDLEQSVQTSLNKADAAISLGLTSATPGQIIKVKTVQDGKPTEWEAVDDRLPKVTSSDAGNVLGVEQIGEHEYGYALTHMPTLNDFIPLGITNASPGQFAKVSLVDDFGNPTAWEAVDMPSGSDEWELIAHINVADDVEKDVTVWEYNNLPRYKYIAYKKVNLVGSGDQTASGCTIQINNESSQPSGMTYGKSGFPQNCIGMIYVMPFGWTHYKTIDATSPNNISLGGFNAMLTALPLSDNAITSIKLSAHTMYKIASGEIWLYGKKG